MNLNPVIERMIQKNKVLQQERRYYKITKHRSPMPHNSKIYYQSTHAAQNQNTKTMFSSNPIQPKQQQSEKKKEKYQGFLPKYRKSQIKRENLILLNKIQKIFNRGQRKDKNSNSISNLRANQNLQRRFTQNYQNRYSTITAKDVDKQQRLKKCFSEDKKGTIYVNQSKQSSQNCVPLGYTNKQLNIHRSKGILGQIGDRKKSTYSNIGRCLTEQISQFTKLNYKNQEDRTIKSIQKLNKNNLTIKEYKFQSQNYFQQRLFSKTQLINPNDLQTNNIQKHIQRNKILLASRQHAIKGFNFKVDFVRGYEFYQIILTPQQQNQYVKTDTHHQQQRYNNQQLPQIKEQQIKSKYVSFKIYSPQQNKRVSPKQNRIQLNQQKGLQRRQPKWSKFSNFKTTLSQIQGKQLFQTFDYDYEAIISQIKLSKAGEFILTILENPKLQHKRSVSFKEKTEFQKSNQRTDLQSRFDQRNKLQSKINSRGELKSKFNQRIQIQSRNEPKSLHLKKQS